ncbi:alpha/beta fold hydrolase [Paenibacillus sp. GCM10012307]|uniref:Alpha/beta fold hydrolase n=1 Tax=Paenibacillus roseus TaxID=2798579 RepID=A0A934MSA1_9BACL|nr:alpha/beta fold hydrolase [Paenibacillus roseus]MBJ6363713.1 alpha/beta fold hydrolase [Paenibacillus roseus]
MGDERSFQYATNSAETRIIRGNIHYASANQPQGTIVIIHGFKGFKDWGMFPYVADRLSAQYDVIRFNLSRNGVGESLTEFDELEQFGRQTFSGDLEDLGALLERVRTGNLPLEGRQPTADRLVLLGHSRGGGEAILWALDHPDTVHGVISWNGSVRFTDIFGETGLQEIRERGIAYTRNARTGQMMPLERVIADDLEQNKARFHITERITELRVPLALIQGDQDYRRLIEGSEQLVERRPDIEWISIAGGDHTYGAKHPFQGTTPALDAAIEATLKAVGDIR